MRRTLINAFSSVVILLLATSANANLDEELVFYFTFDNVKDQTIIDESGNGLDAEILENAEIVNGKYGEAIRLTRQSGDCVNIRSQDKLKIKGEITMMAWVYQETWKGKRAHWFDKDCHTAGSSICYGMAIADLGNGPEIWLFLGSQEDQGQQRQEFAVPSKMADKKWNHVAGSYDGRTVKIYLDGKVIGKGDKEFNFVGDNDADVRIGCAKDRAHVTFVNGSIDEAAIWRRALNDEEIKQAMVGNFLAVSPSDKAAATWADMKKRAIAR